MVPQRTERHEGSGVTRCVELREVSNGQHGSGHLLGDPTRKQPFVRLPRLLVGQKDLTNSDVRRSGADGFERVRPRLAYL